MVFEKMKYLTNVLRTSVFFEKIYTYNIDLLNPSIYIFCMHLWLVACWLWWHW